MAIWDSADINIDALDVFVGEKFLSQVHEVQQAAWAVDAYRLDAKFHFTSLVSHHRLQATAFMQWSSAVRLLP